MLRNAIRIPIAVGLVIVSLVVGALLAQFPHISQGQSEEAKTLKSHLTELRDSHASAYIGLIAPIDEKPGWAVPENLTDDAGETITRIRIGEIGEDFVCIDSIGQGFTITDCIPFSNIAYVRQPAL